jgi:rod shape-determining protein MreC
MPIVTDAGLVGKIVATSSKYSIGQLMLHKDFRASVQVERERVDGILFWTGGEHLLLKNIPRTAEVKPGDVIITSDISTIFPAGIRVGLVAKADITQGALFYSVEVSPAADFGRLEEVFVVLHTPDSSRIALDQKVK